MTKRIKNEDVIFIDTICSHGTPAIEIEDASPEVHCFLKKIVMNNHTPSFDYKAKIVSGAFIQGGGHHIEGWILIEFWKKDGVQAFLDYANAKWQELLMAWKEIDELYKKYHAIFLHLNEGARVLRKQKYPDLALSKQWKKAAKELERQLNSIGAFKHYCIWSSYLVTAVSNKRKELEHASEL